jgi:hypothetical protein
MLEKNLVPHKTNSQQEVSILDSLEENISYTLMGKYNLMLYPYITRVECQYCDKGEEYQLYYVLND